MSSRPAASTLQSPVLKIHLRPCAINTYLQNTTPVPCRRRCAERHDVQRSRRRGNRPRVSRHLRQRRADRLEHHRRWRSQRVPDGRTRRIQRARSRRGAAADHQRYVVLQPRHLELREQRGRANKGNLSSRPTSSPRSARIFERIALADPVAGQRVRPSRHPVACSAGPRAEPPSRHRTPNPR